MYKLIISAEAKRELKKMKWVYQEAIVAALEEIRHDPYVGKPLMRELLGKYSYRVGMYRIIYKIKESDKTVLVFTAGHRATVYN